MKDYIPLYSNPELQVLNHHKKSLSILPNTTNKTLAILKGKNKHAQKKGGLRLPFNHYRIPTSAGFC
jgi:hypothetical protein